MSRAPTDLSEVVRETTEALASVIQHAGCSLVVRADAPVVGEWDRHQLGRIISSLLDNATKFGAGKPIEVTVQREGDQAVARVRDHGPGIPPDGIGRIFELYERAVSTDHYGGLGIGLFVARAIAEAHGGALTVSSLPGEGATFTARLPLEPPRRG